MKKMNRIAALVLALIMCLGMMGTASAAPSDVQITKQGKEESVENGAVKLSKTIAGTETENVFDITLKVTTSENLEESAISPNTAVVLVIDSSSSMIDNEYGDNTRLYAAKESARSFVDSYVNDYQKQVQSDPDLVRKLAVVNFDSTSYTTYKMEQLKADSAAATATAVKAAIGDPSKDVPNTDRYRPNYGTYDGISVHSGTNIEAGLTTAKNMLDALDTNEVPAKNQYVILLSDGEASYYIGASSIGSDHSTHNNVTNAHTSSGVGTGTAVGDEIYQENNLYSVYIADANDTVNCKNGRDCPCYGEKVTTWLGHFSHIVSTPSSPKELTKFFERISKLITVYANAWTVNDPMGEYIEFDSVTANAEHTSFNSDTNNLKWDLRLDEPVVDATVTPTTYTYEMTYRVKLDNLAEGFVAGVANPTNGSTVLDYFMSENRDDPDPKLEQANFDVPAVKGLQGSLEFTKVDDQGKPLSGAEFTLALKDETGWTSKTDTSDDDGKISFTNIPSGHKYTLTETTTPDGYVSANPIEVEVSFGKTTANGVEITEKNPLTVFNDRAVAEVTVTKTFKGLPEELWPDVTVTLTNTEDETKSYFATLPEDDETPWVADIVVAAPGTYTVSESAENVPGWTLTLPETSPVTVDIGDTKAVAIENVYTQDVGDLIITKTFSGDRVTMPEGLSFTVTGPHDYSATIAYTDFNNDSSYTIEDLPVGDYTVSESNTNVDGHTVVTTYKVNGKETSTAAVIKNGSANIEVDNDYTKIIGDLIVTKDVAGDLTEEDFDGKSITFTVSGPEGYNGPASFTLPESDDTPWAWSISDVPLGIYTIAESGADVNDYNLTTSFMVNGKAADTATVNLTKAGATIDITNTYSMKVGSLTITKRNNGTTPEEVTLTVTGPHEFSEEVVLNANSWTKKFENLPIGTYTVTEDTESANVTGYTLTVSGEGEVTVTEDGSAEVEITNRYEANPGVLKLVKKIKQDQGDPQVKYVKLQVSGKTTNGDPFSQTVTLNKGNKWQATIDIPAGKYTVAEIKQFYADEYFSLTKTEWNKTDVTVLPGQTEISESNTVICTNTYTLGEAASLEIPVRKIVERGEGGNTDPAGERVFRFKMTIADYISPRGKVDPGTYEVTFNGQELDPAHGVYTFDLVVDGSGKAEGMLKITANPADLHEKNFVIRELSATETGYLPDSAWTYDETVYEARTYYDGKNFGVNMVPNAEPDEKWDGVTAEFKNLYTFVTEEPPKTGDNSQLGLWMALMVLSAAGFVFTMKRRSAQN